MQCAFGLDLAFASRLRRNGWRGPRLPFRQGSLARSATAALLAVTLASLGALAGELETIEIVSDPGDDGTYSSDGEDNTIIFRATWVQKVSVRGADLVFTLGDEEREAVCPQTPDCNTCPVFNFDCTYEVQPGDLDEDGVSIPAASVQYPFRGSITRNDSNINQATCTTSNTRQDCPYPGMEDNAAHRVDGGPADSAEPEEPEEPDDPEEPTDPPDQGGSAENEHTGRIAAALLAIGPPQIGTIDGADDVDYYRIDLAGSATVQVDTAGRSNTHGELLAGDGALIAADEDSGSGDNFRITEALDAGVYYVAVSGAGGEYALSAKIADVADQGGTAASSALLTLYGDMQVQTVQPSALLSSTGRIDEAGTDLDHFRIDVPRDGTDVTVRSAGGTDTTARLLDGALQEIDEDDGGDGNFQIEQTLDAGVYYVEVGGHEAGPYRVLAWGSDPDCACAEPDMTAMDHGDTDETSTLMAIGPPLTGAIDDADDVDVFRVDLAGSATVVFETAGPTDTTGTLRDGAGTALATADSGGPAMNFSISEELAPGVYYLEVSGAAGNYAVSAQLGGESDHGDTAGVSTLLTLYSQDDVDNIKPSALLSTAAQIDAADTDIDVFRLDVPQDMTDVTIRSAGSLDTHARLRDASLMEVKMDDGSEGPFRIEATLDAGVYYVEVSGHETGRYRVLAWGDSQQECNCAMDDDEDNGS